MINGDDMIMDDITAVSLTAPEVTTLPDYTLGRQSADFHVTEWVYFQVTSVLFSGLYRERGRVATCCWSVSLHRSQQWGFVLENVTRPWAHDPLLDWKQAWRRPTCPSPVTTYVCMTWRIPSWFFMCLHERCITGMEIVQVTKLYSYTSSQIDQEQQCPQKKNKCVGLWRTWSLGATTLRTSAVLPSADIETLLGRRWIRHNKDLEIFCHFSPWLRLKFFVPPAVPQNILFFLLEETDPSASVIVLAAVHPKDRKKNLVEDSGERYGWWCLSFICTFWRSQIFGVPWIFTFDASIFSEHLEYFFTKTVVPGSSWIHWMHSHQNSETPLCQVRGKVWKEVVVFRDLRAVQIFKIDSYGHQHYRRNGRVRCWKYWEFDDFRHLGDGCVVKSSYLLHASWKNDVSCPEVLRVHHQCTLLPGWKTA